MNSDDIGFEDGGVVRVVKPDEVFLTTPEQIDKFHDQGPDDLSLTFDFSEAEEEEISAEVGRRVKCENNLAKASATSKVLLLIIDAELPRRAAYQLAYACGMGALCGGSAINIAKKFGMSKQAFEQEGERLLASLDIRKNNLEKDDEASKNYSKTNYIKPKI